MDNKVEELLNEAIRLELNISDLYKLFSEKITADKDFWWQLVMEEKNHAALLRTGKEFLRFNKFPRNLLPESLEDIKKANNTILGEIKKFNVSTERMQAFEIAYQLEVSTGEIHYQKYMSGELDDELNDIFKKLNRADIDHATRIKNQWDKILTVKGDKI